MKRANLAAAGLTILSMLPSQAASPIKLNGVLVSGGNVSVLQFSPDSSRVLYLADQNVDGVFETFSIPSAGGTPVKLNGTLVSGGDVSTSRFSPDSSRVLYLADQTVDQVFEVFSVPSAGGTPVKHNGTLVSGGDVSSLGLFFSPDSSRLLYLADQTVDEVFEVFSVPSAGGTAVKLNGTLVSGGDVGFAQFSPDSSRVMYLADQDVNGMAEIFSVPSAGGTPVKLNGTLVSDGEVFASQFSPDSSRVLYRADQDVNGIVEIYSVPSAGGTPVKLNGTLVSGGDVSSFGLQFSPDSSRVLYHADQNIDGVPEVFIVPAAGGTPVKLSGTMVTGGGVDLQGIQFSHDSSRVLYLADQDVDDIFELFSVPSAGGTPVKLNGTMVSGGDVGLGNFRFTPDSSRVVYLADQHTDGVNELFTVPSAGGTPVKLNGALPTGGLVQPTFEVTPDSSRVIYLADQHTDDVVELFIVPSDGGTAVKLNGPLVSGGDVIAVHLSPDGSRVLYQADQDLDGMNEIYVRVIQANWSSGISGNWDTNANWNNGFAPDEVMQTKIAAGVTVNMSGLTPRSAFSVELGGGSLTSVLHLQSDANLTVYNTLSVLNNGVLRGDGLISGSVRTNPGGEVRVGAGERLRASGTFDNAGKLEAIGALSALAEFEIDGAFTNTSQIIGRNALFRFNGGLSNSGSMTVSANQADIFGAITNNSGGKIILTGNSTTAFYDAVTAGGGSEIRVSSGSTAVFLGPVTGTINFTGSGVKIFENTASPGPLASSGSTIVESSGVVSVPYIRETSLTLYGPMSILANGTTSGTSRLNQLTIDGGTLDLNDNDLIIDYDGSSPVDEIQNHLFTGAIFSSTANASTNPKFALGYIESSGNGTFSGQAVDGTTLIIAYTLQGDGNLDGKVNTLDFNLLAGAFGQNGQYWINGDYDHNGVVDSQDFNSFVANHGNSFNIEAAAALGALVPEPTGAATLLAGLILARRRRQ